MQALLSAHGRTFTLTAYRAQDVSHALPESMSSATILSSLETYPKVPQTLTEKIVQRHSLGLSKGKFLKTGDYTRLSPSRLMTHDNSWPVRIQIASVDYTTHTVLGSPKVHAIRSF